MTTLLHRGDTQLGALTEEWNLTNLVTSLGTRLLSVTFGAGRYEDDVIIHLRGDLSDRAVAEAMCDIIRYGKADEVNLLPRNTQMTPRLDIRLWWD